MIGFFFFYCECSSARVEGCLWAQVFDAVPCFFFFSGLGFLTPLLYVGPRSVSRGVGAYLFPALAVPQCLAQPVYAVGIPCSLVCCEN
jgi:hypothetical protein